MVRSGTALADAKSIVSDNTLSIQINLTNLTPPRLRSESVQRRELVDRPLTYDLAFEWLRDHGVIGERVRPALLAGLQADAADRLFVRTGSR